MTEPSGLVLVGTKPEHLVSHFRDVGCFSSRMDFFCENFEKRTSFDLMVVRDDQSPRVLDFLHLHSLSQFSGFEATLFADYYSVQAISETLSTSDHMSRSPKILFLSWRQKKKFSTKIFFCRKEICRQSFFFVDKNSFFVADNLSTILSTKIPTLI